MFSSLMPTPLTVESNTIIRPEVKATIELKNRPLIKPRMNCVDDLFLFLISIQ